MNPAAAASPEPGCWSSSSRLSSSWLISLELGVSASPLTSGLGSPLLGSRAMHCEVLSRIPGLSHSMPVEALPPYQAVTSQNASSHHQRCWGLTTNDRLSDLTTDSTHTRPCFTPLPDPSFQTCLPRSGPLACVWAWFLWAGEAAALAQGDRVKHRAPVQSELHIYNNQVFGMSQILRYLWLL